MGLVGRQVCDDVVLGQLLNIDTLPTGAGLPLFKEFSPGDIFRFQGNV